MKTLFTLVFLIWSAGTYAQVAINTEGTLPDNSAMLDVKSTSKGLLLPRMTLAQRNAISSPATGLMIWQTDDIPGFYYNTGSPASPLWVIAGTGSGWGLSGNSGTSAVTNFIGTIDSVAFIIKVNSKLSGKIDPSSSNTLFGYRAMNSNTSGTYNSAFGSMALISNTTGYYNTAIGANALISNYSGMSNTATGIYSLYSNGYGQRNTAIGHAALYFNFGGSENTALGYLALQNNNGGSQNTTCGSHALRVNVNGLNNAVLGYMSLTNNLSGNDNTATGATALYSNSIGSYNTADGREALRDNITEYNTAVGYHASHTTSSGFRNT